MHERKSLSLVVFALLGALVLLPGAGFSQTLPPTPAEVFLISGKADGADTLIVEWQIADGYYLYGNKFRFAADSIGVDLGYPQFPPAEIKSDEFFGDLEVYRHQVAIRLPVKRDPGADQIVTLQATSQGCSDAGICYPPHTQTILLTLAPTAGEAAETDPDNPPPAADSAPQPAAAPEARPSADQGSLLSEITQLGNTLGLDEEDEILDPEEAYKFTASVEDGAHLRLFWSIAEGTYLYRDKIKLALKDAPGVALGEFELPPAEIKQDTVRPDGSIGDVAVYHNEIDFRVPLLRSDPGATDISLETSFQGCAERGICYPPMKKSVSLALPEIAASQLVLAGDTTGSGTTPAQPAPKTAAEAVTEQDRIASALAGGNAWLVLMTFFGFGLLLALTPCVFPMIPILSGIIAGQGVTITTHKAFVLSLVYVLAMAATYTVAGVLAGLFGQNLQAAFQNPWILSIFAGVFVALAISMFGFYELQLPSSLQSRLTEISNRQQGGSLVGVAIMGLLSALIVGPCVAPPLAGALIYIGQTGDALLGGSALFALSLGMGAPLIAIGTSAGKLLPRAGAWMNIVKAVFGVLMLAVAIILLERIVPAEIALALWGSLLIVSAVYMGALRGLPVEASGWDHLWKGLGLVILVYGVLMLIGAAAGSKDTVQPLRGLNLGGSGTEQQHLAFRRIKTVADLEREVAEASASGRPVMLDFYADWCVSCKEMERYTFSDPAVIGALDGFVLLQADVTANDEQDKALLQGHFGLPGPPSIMFYGRDGKERKNYRVVGFMDAGTFAGHARRAVE